jgi:hypothetical protein
MPKLVQGISSLANIESLFEEKQNVNKLVKYWRLSLGRKKKQKNLKEENIHQKIDKKNLYS